MSSGWHPFARLKSLKEEGELVEMPDLPTHTALANGP